jgi:hypothetical protein
MPIPKKAMAKRTVQSSSSPSADKMDNLLRLRRINSDTAMAEKMRMV